MKTLIKTVAGRRSVRAYSKEGVTKDQVLAILESGAWAPSGNNLQPWRFAVVMEDQVLIEKLASLTIYEKWVRTAPCLIVVYLDKQLLDPKLNRIYLKHAQAIGSAIQNMLLMAHEMGLGTCWIGEILKNEDTVREMLSVEEDFELMAVITLGHPEEGKTHGASVRKPLEDLVVAWR